MHLYSKGEHYLSSPSKDLAHTSVRHSQLPANVARSHSTMREFNNLAPDLVRERSSIDEEASKLVHSALPAACLHC